MTVMAGEVAAVCISEKKGTAKQNIGSCNFIEDWGLEKDLFLPFKQQTRKVKAGDQVLASLYIDKSGRL